MKLIFISGTRSATSIFKPLLTELYLICVLINIRFPSNQDVVLMGENERIVSLNQTFK